jgi:endo-1,4-beta-xylanase
MNKILFVLAAFAAMVGAQVTGSVHNGPLATGRGMHLGAAVTFPTNATILTNYDTVLSNEYNTVECENAMKFGSIEATRNKFTWGPADAILSFAQQHGMSTRGHNFIWYQQAGFLANLTTANTPRDTFLAIIKNHIDSVAGRYKGKIYEWDAVNEAIDESQSDGDRRSSMASFTTSHS